MSVVITNGSLLATSLLRRFPSVAGFEVTLFSADERLHDSIAGRPAFARTLNGLVGLQKFKLGFILACVVTKQNAHDVKRTIELGIALGAQAVLFNRVNLSRSAMPFARELIPDPSSLKQSLDAAQDAAKSYGISVAVSVPIPPCVVDPRDYPQLHFGWCPRGNEESYYTVAPNGQLRPCNHSSVILGDLRTSRFSELVSGAEAKKFWSVEPARCARCEHPLRDLCRGGCPAAADECFGSREYADPIVELMAEEDVRRGAVNRVIV
jgi:radical SAM protein with 4Fe4S-binding SPASM domain